MRFEPSVFIMALCLIMKSDSFGIWQNKSLIYLQFTMERNRKPIDYIIHFKRRRSSVVFLFFCRVYMVHVYAWYLFVEIMVPIVHVTKWFWYKKVAIIWKVPTLFLLVENFKKF